MAPHTSDPEILANICLLGISVVLLMLLAVLYAVARYQGSRRAQLLYHTRVLIPPFTAKAVVSAGLLVAAYMPTHQRAIRITTVVIALFIGIGVRYAL